MNRERRSEGARHNSASTDHAALEVRGLRAWYGQAQVIHDVDLHVAAGEIVGVFGHNGAGKSTLLRTIAGLHRHASGAVLQYGAGILGQHAHQIARSGLYLVREGARAFETLTVDENIQLGGRLAKLAGRQPRADEQIYEVFPLLADRRDVQAGLLSGGQRQALALAVGYASNAKLLLLDEPSTGLAPTVVDSLYGTLQHVAVAGAGFLVAEQNPEWLATLATRGYLLETGRVEAAGPPQSFLASSHDRTSE